MYEQLFKQNKEALDFIIEKEALDIKRAESICQIAQTKLYSKTVIGIASLMTEFAKEYHNKQLRLHNIAAE